MRISTDLIHRQGMTSIQDAQAVLAHTQLQLSTGRRIITPSDDPAGSTRVLSLSETIGVHQQYEKNANAARTRLELEESMLAHAGDVIQRVRELTVQGLNDTLGAEGRGALALEIRQRLEEMMSIANGVDQNGDYMFAGYYSGSARPIVDAGSGVYNYNGDQGQRLLQISATRQVADSDNGADVFMRVNTGSGVQNTFQILNNLATSLESNTPASAALGELDAVLDNLITTRAQVGARLNAIDTEIENNFGLVVTLQGTLSGIQDVDYAEAVTRLNRELAGLQAAQQTYLKVQGTSLFDFL